MSQVLSEHFAREAGEYLAELERLLAAAVPPDPERLFRLVRGVRGSAQLADAAGIAAVAACVEGVARSLADGRIHWSDELRERIAATVYDLATLVPLAGGRWNGAADQRVEHALARWGGFADDADEALAAVPISELFYDDEGPHVVALPGAAREPGEPGPGDATPAEAAEAGGAVPIEALLLRGGRALAAALALRPVIERLIGQADGAAPELRARLQELWDLVELGRSGGDD